MEQNEIENNAHCEGQTASQPDENLTDLEPQGEVTGGANSSAVVSLGKLGRVE